MSKRFGIILLAAVAAATGLGFPCNAEEKSSASDHAKPPATAPAGAVRKIDINEFDKLRREKDHVVLDVRTPQEFAAGHVPSAVNVPVQSPDFDEKVAGLDKNKPYLVHCARGGRSAQAVARMEKMGFKDLSDFSGGMEAWKKAGKPTTRAADKPEEKPDQKAPQK